MNRIERGFLTTALLLAGGLAGLAAEKKPLTVDAAVSLAVSHSRGLDAARARTNEAAARTREVSAARLPALRFAGGYTRLSEVPPFEISLPFLSNLSPSMPTTFVVSPVYFNNYSLRLNLQQPVFTGFRLKKAAEASRLVEQASLQDGLKDQTEIETGARTAYWNAYRAAELLTVAEENRSRIEVHLRQAADLLAQGMATRNDVLKVQAQLANAELLRLDGRTGVQTSQVLLASLLGLPLDTEFDFQTTGRDIVLDPAGGIEGGTTLEELLAKARTARPDLKSMEMRARAAAAGVSMARSGALPQVFLAGNYYYLRPNARLLPAQDKFYATWDLGLTISLDIWNGNQSGLQTRQAQAQRIQVEDALALLQEQVALEVTQAWLSVRQARDRIAAAAAAVVQAEENLRVTDDRFREGVALSSDVLDAELLLLQAKTSRTQALVDLELARIRLRRSAAA
ncbi:MAG: TolC family protein [Acidobacteriota bacterium]|nr:TolC family protein [Acidobacteriota bacterium]